MKQLIKGNTTLLTAVLIGGISVFTYLGLSASVFDSRPQADLRLEPQQLITHVGEPFTIDIVVKSSVAVNVFAGNLSFNPDTLKITKIDYNTSIADLWAELPWYHNGDGTLHFAGGTTQPGGFTGEGSLISITFTALQSGAGDVIIDEARILQHDGLGTDAALAPSVDALVTINATTAAAQILFTSGPRTAFIATNEPKSTDLNNDGKQSVADVSIFMADLTTQNKRSDFDEDGRVSLKDLSILMRAK